MKTRLRGLYKRGNTFWLAHQKDGRRFFVSLQTDDYVQAVQKASVILRTPSLNPTQGLRADIDAFLKHQRDLHLFTAATADSKGAILRKFGSWIGWIDTASITTEDIQRFYDHQRQSVKEGSAQTYVMALRSFFGWAVGEKLTRVNPVAEVKVGRVVSPPRRRFCTFAERDQIIAGAPTPELKFVLYCGFHAGLRKNEIIQTRPDWFDLEQGLLHVRKTPTFEPKDKEERTIPLTKEFREFLAEFGLHSPFMLRPEVEQGKSIYRYDFDRPYYRYIEPLGFRWVTPHIMRHTFGSLLASRGCSIYKIAIWMGDEVATTQKHYAKLLPVDPDIELSAGG